MESLVKSDIFFVVTAFALVIVSGFLVAVLIYVILILRDVKNISTRVREESRLFSEDFAALRGNFKKEGVKLKHFVDFFGTIYKRNYRKKSNSQKPL